MQEQSTSDDGASAAAQTNAEGDLRTQHDLYQAILRAQSDLGEGLIVIDGEHITFVNDAFCCMSGRRREELLALRSFLSLVPPEERAFMIANYRHRAAGGAFVKRYETALLEPDETQRRCEIAIETLTPEDPSRIVVIVTDISERKREQLALAESEARLREQHALHEALLHAQSNAGVGLFIIEGGKVIFANQALCRMFGYTETEIEALPSYLVLAHPADRERVARNHQRRLAGEQFANRYDIAILTKAGERREAEITVGYMPAQQGPRVLVIMVDITDRKHAEGEVRRLATELESRVRDRTAELRAANKELESFAYSISHDLRAPLRGIDGFSQLLLDEYGDRLDAQGCDYLVRVRRAAQRLGKLIDDLLELSRVTRLDMRRETIDLSRMAREILEERARTEPRREVEVVVAPGCTARGDPQLLRVLLENLLDNAWKYTGRTAHARIEFGREPGGEGAVFFVRDNGAGFNMAYADRLFAPFQRLHKPDEFEGTGIGLASVARVVQRHGGKVWAESCIGCGASFRFTLGDGQDGWQ